MKQRKRKYFLSFSHTSGTLNKNMWETSTERIKFILLLSRFFIVKNIFTTFFLPEKSIWNHNEPNGYRLLNCNQHRIKSRETFFFFSFHFIDNHHQDSHTLHSLFNTTDVFFWQRKRKNSQKKNLFGTSSRDQLLLQSPPPPLQPYPSSNHYNNNRQFGTYCIITMMVCRRYRRIIFSLRIFFDPLNKI